MAAAHAHRRMSPLAWPRTLVALMLLMVPSLVGTSAFGDGTESLGAPSVAIASGTGVIAAGLGLHDGPGTLNVDVPSGVDVQQVLLYWEGQANGANPTLDDDIVVGGTNVTGVQIGGPTTFVGVQTASYRADITGLGLVTNGTNAIDLSGLDFGLSSDGAGVLVIVNDTDVAGVFDIRDGNDVAYSELSGDLQAAEPQTFTFAASVTDRIAKVDLFIGSVIATRPNAMKITVGTTEFIECDLFGDSSGPQWDTITLEVPVPAGATSVTAEPLSMKCDGSTRVGKPASLIWIASALTLRPDDTVVAPEISVAVDKTNDADGDGTFTDRETSTSSTTEVGPVPFRLVVTNNGPETIRLTGLTDRIHAATVEGDATIGASRAELDLFAGTATGTAVLGTSGCDLLDGAVLTAGQNVSCDFTLDEFATISATDTAREVRDTVTVTAEHVDQPSITASDDDPSFVDLPVGSLLGAVLAVDKTNDGDRDGTFTDDELAPHVGSDVTFKVIITNTSTDPVALTDLVDTWDGGSLDLFDASAGSLTGNDCEGFAGSVLSAGGSVTCFFSVTGYSPTVGVALRNVIEVRGVPEGTTGPELVDRDDSVVRSQEMPVIAITVDKTNDGDRDGTFTDSEQADPEANRDVTFRLVVSNPSSDDLRVTSLVDVIDVPVPTGSLAPLGTAGSVDLLAGIVTGAGLTGVTVTDNTCAGLDGATVAAGGSSTCEFTLSDWLAVAALGHFAAATSIDDVVTVTGVAVDDPSVTASDDDDSNVTTPPSGTRAASISLDKTNDGDTDGTWTDLERVGAPAQAVAFRLVITNTGTVPLALTALTDTWEGAAIDLFSTDLVQGSLTLVANGCGALLGTVLAPAASQTCNVTIGSYSPAYGAALANVAEIRGVTVDQPTTEVVARDDSEVMTMPQTGIGAQGMALTALGMLGVGAAIIADERRRRLA